MKVRGIATVWTKLFDPESISPVPIAGANTFWTEQIILDPRFVFRQWILPQESVKLPEGSSINPRFRRGHLGNEEKLWDHTIWSLAVRFETSGWQNKSPKACKSGRFSAEYENLGFNPDTKSYTKILWDFV
jgi:hypothetical protein